MAHRIKWWWVDRRTCIVVRSHRAVRLGLVQFAVFLALHEGESKRRGNAHNGKRLHANRLADIVYNGSSNPSTKATIHNVIRNMNVKLAHLGLKVVGVNRGVNSFYRIEYS